MMRKSPQRNNRNRSMRSGMTIIETAFSLMILIVVTGYAIKGLKSSNRGVQIQTEMDYKRTLESGMKSNLEQIIDIFEPICTNVNSDALSQWGWAHANCDLTSPFPTYLATEKLRYTIDFSSLSAQNSQSLQDFILSSLQPYCSLDSVTNSNMDLLCPNLSNLTYDLGLGSVASAHTLGSDINPLIVPVATVTLSRREGDGTINPQTYTYSFQSIFEKRRQITVEKFNTVRNVLKTYYNNQLSIEVANAPSTGLNSIDDEFVPWAWKAFGDNTSDVLGSICDTAGGNTCSNLDTDNIWRTNLSGDGLYIRRLSTNLFSGDLRMATDGFGNQVTFYPMMSQCSNSDVTTCTTTAPPVPQQNYYNIARPPYVSLLYIDTFKNVSSSAPSYGRTYISY